MQMQAAMEAGCGKDSGRATQCFPMGKGQPLSEATSKGKHVHFIPHGHVTAEPWMYLLLVLGGFYKINK